jgi:hypothetical protein
MKLRFSSLLLPLVYADTDNNNGTFTFDGDSGSPFSGGNSPSSGGSDWDYTPSQPPPPPKPVYKDWCRYSIVEWVISRSERAGGANPRSPLEIYWPNSTPYIGEREASRSERYTRNFNYTVNGGTSKLGNQTVSLTELFALPVGEKGVASVTRVGQVRRFKVQQIER